MINLKKYWPIFVLIISILAILSALIAEYFFKILPCQMCLYQRYPYYFIIIFSLIYFFINKISLNLYCWITLISYTVGLFFSLWHVGIEKKILPGFTGCVSIINQSQSLENLKEQIVNQNIITCDEITWSLMGLSAATINSFLLIVLLLINVILIFRKNK